MPHRTLLSRRSRQARVLQLFGRPYLAGFCWQALEPGPNGEAEARTRYASLFCDCAAYACGDLGLASLGAINASKVTLSLAAWLGARVSDAILLLPLEDEAGSQFFWLFVKWRGHFVAGYTDSLYTRYEDGKEAAEQVLELCRACQTTSSSLPTLFAPTKLSESLRYFADLPKPTLWERLSGRFGVSVGHLPPRGALGHGLLWLRRGAWPLGICLLLLLLIAQGDFVFGPKAVDSGLDEAFKKTLGPEELSAIFGKPWQSAFPAKALQPLLDYLDTLPLTLSGWQLTAFEVDCAAKAKDTLSTRSVSLTLHYQATKACQYTGLGREASLSSDGKHVVRRFWHALPKSSDRAFGRCQETLLPAWQCEQRLRQEAKALRLGCQLRFEPAAEKSLAALGKVLAPWQKGQVRFQNLSAAQLAELVPELGKLPGFVVQKLCFAKGRFALDCLVYAQRDLG